MQFFTWGINKPNVREQRAALREDHWAFWDEYESRLIARGPVLDADDPGSATGSIHIVDLKDWDEAQFMAAEEPYAKAGLFRELVLKRFFLELGRTQFDGASPPGSSGFFLYCPAAKVAAAEQKSLAAHHQKYCLAYDGIFACRGSLLGRAGNWDGSVFLIEVPDEDAAADFLSAEPYNAAGLFDGPRILSWRRGGRVKS